ncbi:MAG TPA: hypothetical protein VG223_16810, partial [Solirubrobacteraceae bacterium]|nr:hypothetical protein [Solirubrobacteraceae bacterium]
VREEAIAIGICLVVWLVNGYYDSQIADKYLYVLPAILIGCARVTSMLAAPASAESIDVAVPRAGPARVLEPVGAGVAQL